MLLLLTLVLLGCSQPINVDTNGSLHLPALDTYVFYVDKDMSNAAGLALDESAKQWMTYTDVKIVIEEGPHFCFFEPGCFTFYEISQSELDTLTLDSTYIGYAFWGLVGIARGMPWDELQDTTIHETGHTLGLEHHPRPTFAVMNPNYRGGALHVACDDVQQYYAVRNRSAPTSLPTCSDAPGAFDEAADGGPNVGGD